MRREAFAGDPGGQPRVVLGDQPPLPSTATTPHQAGARTQRQHLPEQSAKRGLMAHAERAIVA